MSVTRADLHRLVDELPEAELSTARRVLYDLKESDEDLPVIVETAPFDDETEEEREAVAEAVRELEEGKGIPHDEAMRKLGLS